MVMMVVKTIQNILCTYTERRCAQNAKEWQMSLIHVCIHEDWSHASTTLENSFWKSVLPPLHISECKGMIHNMFTHPFIRSVHPGRKTEDAKTEAILPTSQYIGICDSITSFIPIFNNISAQHWHWHWPTVWSVFFLSFARWHSKWIPGAEDSRGPLIFRTRMSFSWRSDCHKSCSPVFGLGALVSVSDSIGWIQNETTPGATSWKPWCPHFSTLLQEPAMASSKLWLPESQDWFHPQ